MQYIPQTKNTIHTLLFLLWFGTVFPISFRITSLALGQSYDFSTVCEALWWIWPVNQVNLQQKWHNPAHIKKNKKKTTTKQNKQKSTTKPHAYFMGYSVFYCRACQKYLGEFYWVRRAVFCNKTLQVMHLWGLARCQRGSKYHWGIFTSRANSPVPTTCHWI